MTQKQKARQQVPGKDGSKRILAHCAACAAPIHENEMVGFCVLPVGLTFDGRIIGDKMHVCAACMDRAESSEAGRESVDLEIVGRYRGLESDSDTLAPVAAYSAGGLH